MNSFSEIPLATYEILYEILKSFADVNEVILYGSRAKGNYNERSDIDLVIRNSDIDRHYLGKILMEIRNSDIPYKVDLQIYENIKNLQLREHIQRIGKIIYTKQ